MATRSSSRILSNSSMQTTPPSASTIAPPSRANSPFACFTTEAVKPAAELPLPLVYTPTGATRSTNLRNCDLAVDGSPSMSTLMSPRSLFPSVRMVRLPPTSRHKIAFLMSFV
jgi:hypothetical protein